MLQQTLYEGKIITENQQAQLQDISSLEDINAISVLLQNSELLEVHRRVMIISVFALLAISLVIGLSNTIKLYLHKKQSVKKMLTLNMSLLAGVIVLLFVAVLISESVSSVFGPLYYVIGLASTILIFVLYFVARWFLISKQQNVSFWYWIVHVFGMVLLTSLSFVFVWVLALLPFANNAARVYLHKVRRLSK